MSNSPARVRDSESTSRDPNFSRRLKSLHAVATASRELSTATTDQAVALSHAEKLVTAAAAGKKFRAAPLARRRDESAGRRLKSDHEKFQDAHEKCMREFLAWDACTPDVGADDDALPDFPTDDFTPPPTSAYWLKEMCVNSANLIDTICSIRCGECAEKEDAFYTCFNGEACSEWYSPGDFSCEGYDGNLMYDQETCCLKDHENFCEESKTCEFKVFGCPEGGDGECQMFQTWCEETESCIWSWEECGDPEGPLEPLPVPVPLDPEPTSKPTTTEKPTMAPVAAPTSKPILPPTPRPSLTAAPTILPTTAAPSTTAAPTATPATGAPVASSPLGGDGVGDRDPNDDPSTDAAAARGVTVVAASVALFYAL